MTLWHENLFHVIGLVCGECKVLNYSLLHTWASCWINNQLAGDLRYDINEMNKYVKTILRASCIRSDPMTLICLFGLKCQDTISLLNQIKAGIIHQFFKDQTKRTGMITHMPLKYKPTALFATTLSYWSDFIIVNTSWHHCSKYQMLLLLTKL